jgi:sporulation protein YlmC with PRC-barrel domain
MKKLLLSTAILAATTAAVQAQEVSDMFRTQADPMEIHASDFIGKRVYSSQTAVEHDSYKGVQTDWDDIGEINDVIMSRDGNVEAVLVDIGGFLGIGERQIAVDMSAIRFVADDATVEDLSDYFLVMNAPRTMLQVAPAYDWHHDAATTPESGMQTPGAASTDTVTDMSTPEPIMRDGYDVANDADLNAEMLTGAPVYDVNDERIGEVSELLITEDGKITDTIIDVGGFLGIGEKPVKLSLGEVDILRTDDGSDVRVYASLTKEELEAMPSYDK